MSKLHNRENDTVVVEASVQKSEIAAREEQTQAWWKENDIFNKSLAMPGGSEPKGDFVFYDGPPFATGTPHYGHILAGTIKDAIPRFWTMNGYHVERKWGWDCHGLPLENLIEKKLGLATKRDIETYGIKNFNEAARSAVLEYADVWKEVVPRFGRFVDMEDDYKTMDCTYTESVWWVFKQLHEKGLVYEGFKSMHLCPRCGTTLSNFEVNQGYKDIKDIAVTVKLPLLDGAGEVTNASLLVWTTTPWTLPGNMAVAVHKDIEYVKVQVKTEAGDELLILAEGRLTQLGDLNYEVVEKITGADLVGRKYQPPFSYFKEVDLAGKENTWTIYHADFVEVGTDGTGAVHIAPAYGDDDLSLAQSNGVPVAHHVGTDGHFLPLVTDFVGRLVKPKDDDLSGTDHKDTDIEILKFLQKSGVILKKENITHSYPHCWRCDTPLLNYATTSWFVRVTDLKEKLIAANDTVQWVPEHVGKNRFGRWLEGARDWAISRQRYWGAPLPIWRNKNTGAIRVMGSKADILSFTKKSGNRYFMTRHAESVLNTTGTISADLATHNGLSEKGKTQVALLASELSAAAVDYIYYSPLERTRETAFALASTLGLPESALIADPRLLEIRFGEFEGKNIDEYHAFYSNGTEYLDKRPEGGETWTEVKQRCGALLYELEAKHHGKNILFVSHNGTLQMLQAAAYGDDRTATAKHIEDDSYDIMNAELRTLPFVPLPHNDFYELDYHRPYIDSVELVDTDGTMLQRVPDVFDCWFESGSMPYAQHHFMGEDREQFEKNCFPAQFIAEGLDQTRGWFYSTLVLGVALFGKSPYQNVIVNGLALAEDGKKMSKSLHNYPDPMELASETGVDAIRLYLLTSPIIRGEDLHFSKKEVLELQRKNIGRLHNVLALYELFADGTMPHAESSHVLDRWILARLNALIAETTAGYRGYELDRATRPIADFIEDLSVWYVRRSRERLKVADESDKALALATLRYTLRTLALVIAPVMPFYAEHLYRAVRADEDAESVHLASWPTYSTVDETLLANMKHTRDIVTAALEARTKAGIKVRQPLATLTVTCAPLDDEFLLLIQDEVNVKNVQIMEGEGLLAVMLDTVITPELKAEGDIRSFIRAIQQARKDAGLNPEDRIVIHVSTALAVLVGEAIAGVTTPTGATGLVVVAEVLPTVVAELGSEFTFAIAKV